MRRVVAAILLLAAMGRSAAEESAPAPADDAQVGRELDAIRDQVVALDIEAALAALDALVQRPGVTDARRVDAYDLRAQAHAASDDLAAVEKDYRAILQLNPDYAPKREVTSKKAMDRFAKLAAAMIGTVHIDLAPKDATLTVDDRPATIDAVDAFHALAGERHLRLTRKGFDTMDTTVRVVANGDTLVKVRLVPNARRIVVRTDVDGVAVTLDGTPAGVTARVAGSAEGEAVLAIDDVAVGEHQIGLMKSCFATENLEELVSVDVADRSPKLLRLVTMRPARTRVTATGAGYDGELRIDGARVASLPLSSFDVCPGARTIEVVASGRVVWAGSLSADAVEPTVDLSPRPNAVLVGAEWPGSWNAVKAGWSVIASLPAPEGADLTTREGWNRVALPAGTDLAVGVIPRAGIAGDQRVVLYGPVLQEVEDRAAAPDAARPLWREATLGAEFSEDRAGRALFASIVAGQPAAAAGLLPGDRLVAIAGQAVRDSASAQETIAKSELGAPLALSVESPSGPTRRVTCTTVARPVLSRPAGDKASPVVRAAWAAVDAAAGGADAAVALANLASLLDRAGRDEAALTAWRRVRALGGAGVSARAAYAVGIGLQTAGKPLEAIEAFRQAGTEASTAGDAALAAAATDRLADLGVAPR